MRFIKYVSLHAPSSRYDIAAEYEIVPLSSASNEDNELEDEEEDEAE